MPKKVQKKKKRKVKFKPGDHVTGKDRSYKRSIYKMISTTEFDTSSGLFEFQTLGADCVERWKDTGADVNQYQMYRKFSEFRLATKKELKLSTAAKVTYKLFKLLRELDVF